MTFNALMLPAPPSTSTGGLKAVSSSGPTAVKSARLGESTPGSKSFLATLNEVSHRQYPSRPESNCAKGAADISAGSGKVTPESGKTGESKNAFPGQFEDSETGSSAAPPPIPDARQAFEMIQLRFFDFGRATDNNSVSSETQSETIEESNSLYIDNLMGYLQPQGLRSLIDWLAGIGSFEQMQADISAEAGNRYLIEQLAARFASNWGTEGSLGTQTEYIGLWHWLTSAPEGVLNSSDASLLANADALIADFLSMQQTVAAGSTLTADAVETVGQNAAGALELTHLNDDLLVKMTIPSLPEELDLSENAKMAGPGKDAPVPLWMTANPNSEELFGTPSRQVNENTHYFMADANAKAAAEQSANPNFVGAEATNQQQDHGSSIKSAGLKADSLPLAELGGKISPIEGDNRDGGFMFAQDQLPEHLKTLASVTRTIEGAQRGLTSQAMDQIVHKAVLLLNNDQQEVRLELKPEFLGHIRMQIVTENQQVAVKIVAEFPLVKEMLESNLNQLKAQLQAQGLAIDELAVSVANDFYPDDDPNYAQKVAKLQEVRNGNDFVEESSEKSTQSQFRSGDAIAETAIDYFA